MSSQGVYQLMCLPNEVGQTLIEPGVGTGPMARTRAADPLDLHDIRPKIRPELHAGHAWVKLTIFIAARRDRSRIAPHRPARACGRRPFDIVMAWAIDRVGRSLNDLLDTIQHLEACGVDLYLDQQAIDTTTPMGKLVFQLIGAFAEFERTMIRQRIKAGLKRAVAQGVKLGRPKIDGATERKVRRQLAKGIGILKVARSLGIGTGTVQRISGERAMSPRGAEQ